MPEIAVDSNCLNARRKIIAMNELEALNNLGLVDLLVSSAVHVEHSINLGPQRQKAYLYDYIGGSVVFAAHGKIQGYGGAPMRSSRFEEFYELAFGNGKGPHLREQHLPSLRDIIQVDNCWQNHVDYFVTNEKRLHISVNGLRICTPENCLNELKSRLYSYTNTEDPSITAARLRTEGPFILGSNRCKNFGFFDRETGKILLAGRVVNNECHITAELFDNSGSLLFQLAPGARPNICSHTGLMATSGNAEILVGEAKCQRFCVSDDGDLLLAARLTMAGYVVFMHAKCFSASGVRAFEIDGEQLTLSSGVHYGRPK